MGNSCPRKSGQSSVFFGNVDVITQKDGKQYRQWNNTHDVLAVPYDMPIPGYQNGIVNTLRLWKSEATDEFDLDEFNAGSYTEAVARKNLAEQITMVLYPNDTSENGKELRLRQQYFLSSASLQDVINTHIEVYGVNFDNFVEFNGFQLNDTHPSIAVAELMRILIDDYTYLGITHGKLPHKLWRTLITLYYQKLLKNGLSDYLRTYYRVF